MTVDHATCGHVNHITLDGSRHKEIHTALGGLIRKWSSEANSLDRGAAALAFVKWSCMQDLADAMQPFEVEQ